MDDVVIGCGTENAYGVTTRREYRTYHLATGYSDGHNRVSCGRVDYTK